MINLDYKSRVPIYEQIVNEIERYVDKIRQEINSYNLEEYNVTTIYIGGGTPSYIDSKYIYDILLL